MYDDDVEQKQEQERDDRRCHHPLLQPEWVESVNQPHPKKMDRPKVLDDQCFHQWRAQWIQPRLRTKPRMYCAAEAVVGHGDDVGFHF